MEKEKIVNALKNICEGINFKDNCGIISHPLTSHIDVIKEGKMLTLNKNNIKDYINWKCNEIKEEAKDIDDIFMQVNKPYRLTFLYLIKDFLTEEEFNSMMKDCWVMTEYPNQEGMGILLKLFDKSKKELLMTKEELDKFNSLPQVIIIYRGLQDKKAKIRALSWTLSKDKAMWFASRWKNKNNVYQADINKEDVFMYTNDRNEDEVVINPTKLNNIKECVEL
ncbi:MAG: hypothetical protein WC402_03100 [Candidatus Pacearchaeota archaeon]|jgi:hypothetical protein